MEDGIKHDERVKICQKNKTVITRVDWLHNTTQHTTYGLNEGLNKQTQWKGKADLLIQSPNIESNSEDPQYQVSQEEVGIKCVINLRSGHSIQCLAYTTMTVSE